MRYNAKKMAILCYYRSNICFTALLPLSMIDMTIITSFIAEYQLKRLVEMIHLNINKSQIL